MSHEEAARMIVESVYPHVGQDADAIPDPAERLLRPAFG
jgi:hypothetical protein